MRGYGTRPLLARFVDSDFWSRHRSDGFTQAQRAVGSGEQTSCFAVTEKNRWPAGGGRGRRGRYRPATDTEAHQRGTHRSFVFVDDSALQVAVTGLACTDAAWKTVSLRVHVTDQHGSPQSPLDGGGGGPSCAAAEHRNIQDLCLAFCAHSTVGERRRRLGRCARTARVCPPPRFATSIQRAGLADFIQGGATSAVRRWTVFRQYDRTRNDAARGGRTQLHISAAVQAAGRLSDHLATTGRVRNRGRHLARHVTTWDVMVFAATAEGRTARFVEPADDAAPRGHTVGPAFCDPRPSLLGDRQQSHRRAADAVFRRLSRRWSRRLASEATVAFAFGPAAGQTQAYRIGATALSVAPRDCPWRDARHGRRRHRNSRAGADDCDHEHSR